ncbi:MAG: hypothetical protein MK538_19110 [Planctomycetes bacterium]|nr:hypothetical protein [Planctomycetota bacterium]
MKGVTIAALILTLVGGGAVFRSDDLTRRGGSRVPLQSRTGMRACAHGRGNSIRNARRENLLCNGKCRQEFENNPQKYLATD